MKLNLKSIQNMTSKTKSFVFTFVCVFFAVLLNVGGSMLAGNIAFPLYMDSVSTIAVAALFGLIPAIFVAILSNGLLAIFATTPWPFTTCHILTAVFAHLIFKFGGKNESYKQRFSIILFMWAGLASAISNTTVGSSISNFLFRGTTAIPQVDTAVQGIYLISRNLPFAVYWGGTLTNLADKAISVIISYTLYVLITKKLSQRN